MEGFLIFPLVEEKLKFQSKALDDQMRKEQEELDKLRQIHIFMLLILKVRFCNPEPFLGTTSKR